MNLSPYRKRQSPKTGFLHDGDAIPLLENFSFVLALLRTRTAEQMLEAKAHLEKLLPFEVDGSFPVYLHEFPHCRDSALAIDILPYLHYISRDFRPALGSLDLERVIGRIVTHGYNMQRQGRLPLRAFYKLKSYFDPDSLPEWTPRTSEEWADALIAHQLSASSSLTFKNAPWDPHLACSLLPGSQYLGEPKVTLFDLFMGQAYQRFSKRALEDHPIHLLSSIIQPMESLSLPEERPFAHSQTAPFVFYWGSPEQLHTLTCDGETSLLEKEPYVLTCHLPPEVPSEGEASYEVSFYLNLHPAHSLTISGGKANTFQIGEKIQIASEGATFTLQFDVLAGEGQFFGHLLRGNRPQQRAHQGEKRFEAYDWQIALRTIRRTEACTLRITLFY
ncbi:MAG: hypothetical protein JSS61_03965 [Verrucomicrobia bacterium]|nr:hypothetical protein [Verrucomicrobiota bacterium]